MSSPGVHFQDLTPNTSFTPSSSPFWYRAVLERASQRFSDQTAAVVTVSSDPLVSPDYQLQSSTSRELGNNLIERTLAFSSISGPVKLRN